MAGNIRRNLARHYQLNGTFAEALGGADAVPSNITFATDTLNTPLPFIPGTVGLFKNNIVDIVTTPPLGLVKTQRCIHSYWIWSAALETGFHLSSNDGGAGSMAWRAHTSGSAFFMNLGGQQQLATASVAALFNSAWHNVQIDYNPTIATPEIKYYFDGSLFATFTPLNNPNPWVDKNFCFFNEANSMTTADFALAEIRVYKDRDWTTDDVTALYEWDGTYPASGNHQQTLIH